MRRTAVKLLVVCLAVFGGWMAFFSFSALGVRQLPLEFSLKHGSTLKGVARQLTASGVLREPWSFTMLARMLGKAGQIKAGNYELEADLTPLQLLGKLTEGDATQSKVKFIEGWNIRQIRKALDEHPALVHASKNMNNQELMAALGAAGDHPEGLLFPDTYYFSNGMSDISVMKRAYQTMQAKLAEAWAGRDPDVPYTTPYQALILASIVEKETAKAEERPLIAAVFLNRLRYGMRLQTDPTVIYGLGESFDGNLHKYNLTTDTPYNTYTRAGLPPTPIAMPGMESIRAVLHPAQSKALYFVARGDGGHQFSNSLAEHNRAVARYQLSK